MTPRHHKATRMVAEPDLNYYISIMLVIMLHCSSNLTCMQERSRTLGALADVLSTADRDDNGRLPGCLRILGLLDTTRHDYVLLRSESGLPYPGMLSLTAISCNFVELMKSVAGCEVAVSPAFDRDCAQL